MTDWLTYASIALSAATAILLIIVLVRTSSTPKIVSAFGRAGLIAARLLVELGIKPLTAINEVRKVRPGAIETRDQEEYVLNI